MRIDVLSIGAFPEATNVELASRFAVTHHFNRPTPDVLSAELKTRIRVIATEANHGADRALIAALPNLELIALFGVGTDFVDLAEARDRDIPVTNTPGILTDEVADLAIGLMLASARQILFADRYVREGTWARKGPVPLGRSVGGKTIGLVGLGGIGRAIADRAAAFRMRVIYTGPRRKPDAPYEYVTDLVELAAPQRLSGGRLQGGAGDPSSRLGGGDRGTGSGGHFGECRARQRGRRARAGRSAGARPARPCRARCVRERARIRRRTFSLWITSSCSRTTAARRSRPAPRSGGS